MSVGAHPITKRFGAASAGQTLLYAEQCPIQNSHSCTDQFCPHKDLTYHFRGRSVCIADKTYLGPPSIGERVPKKMKIKYYGCLSKILDTNGHGPKLAHRFLAFGQRLTTDTQPRFPHLGSSDVGCWVA